MSADPAEPFDVGRLDAEERALWSEHFGSSIPGEGPALRVWSFGYVCMFELGRIPPVVTETLEALDPDNLIRQYQDDVRRARREGGP